MKLKARQKKILLTTALIFFLVVLIMTSVFLVVNKESGKKSNKNSSPTPSLPSDNPNLIENRNQTVSEIELELSNKNIEANDLLEQLKTNYGLDTNSIS
jgi:flagellar basal body-associated protein FliL